MSDLIALADAHCTPRRGSEHRLSEARVRELLPQVPGWDLVENGHALVKTFTFQDYYRTTLLAEEIPNTRACSPTQSSGSNIMRIARILVT